MRIPAKMLRAVWLAAPQKDIRPYLNGVHVEVLPSHSLLVATDGRRIHVGRVDHMEAVPRALTIPNHAITAALTGKPDHLILRGHTVAGKIAVDFEEPEGRYPDWRRVMYKEVAKAVPIINHVFLTDLAKAAQLLGGKREGVALHAVSGGVVAKLPGRSDFVALVMGQIKIKAVSDDALLSARWDEAMRDDMPGWIK